jgi:hypothetical protein
MHFKNSLRMHKYEQISRGLLEKFILWLLQFNRAYLLLKNSSTHCWGRGSMTDQLVLSLPLPNPGESRSETGQRGAHEVWQSKT